AGDFSEILPQLRRIDVDGANNLEPFAARDLPNDTDTDRPEPHVHDADWHCFSNPQYQERNKPDGNKTVYYTRNLIQPLSTCPTDPLGALALCFSSMRPALSGSVLAIALGWGLIASSPAARADDAWSPRNASYSIDAELDPARRQLTGREII